MGKNNETSDNPSRQTEKSSLTKSDSMNDEIRDAQKNGNVKLRNTSSVTNEVLPNCSINADCDKKQDGLHEQILPNGNRLIQIESNGQTSEFEYDSQNQPLRYKSFSGEEYINTDLTTADGKWISKTNRIQDKDAGYQIKFDTTTGATTIKDVSANVQVEIDATGKETTSFPNSSAKLVKSTEDGVDKFEMLDASGTRRSMLVKDNRLTEYTDENGITYTRSETPSDSTDRDGNIIRNYIFYAKQGDREIPGEFLVSGDSSGTVLIRDSNKIKEKKDDACKRTYLNGNVATSDADGQKRTLKTPDGTIIATTSDTNSKMIFSKTVTKPDGSLVEAKYYNGAVNSITTTSADGQTSKFQKVSFQMDTTVSMSPDGANSGIWFKNGMPTADNPSLLVDTSDLESAPRVMQKTPPQVNLKAELEEAAKHKVGITNLDSYENAMWFYRSVNYGGIYDYKSPATRFTDEKGQNIIVKDQLGRPEYEDFGNWNYALLGRECGFTQTQVEREAGAVQIEHGTSKPEWGNPGIKITKGVHIGGTGTYGDDPQDNKMVKQGYTDYDDVKNEAA